MLFYLFFSFILFVTQHVFSLCLRVLILLHVQGKQNLNLPLSSMIWVKLPWKGFSGWTKKVLPRFDGETVSCPVAAWQKHPQGQFLGGPGGSCCPHPGWPWAVGGYMGSTGSKCPCPAHPGPPLRLEKSRR